MSRAEGGIERAGATTAGRAAATWRMGSGLGIGGRVFFGSTTSPECVARAGVLARDRLTAGFDAFVGFVALDAVRFRDADGLCFLAWTRPTLDRLWMTPCFLVTLRAGFTPPPRLARQAEMVA
jgi:hypothetical protein